MILSLRYSPSFKQRKSSDDRSNRIVFLFKPTVFAVLKTNEN